MFEPLSALAVLGFTTGTLGFIVSTISRLDEKTQEIRECKSRLDSFHSQLEVAYMQLKVWHSTWIGNKAFPRQTYVYFWGTEGLENIESRVNDIIKLSNQIENLLYRPDDCETESPLVRSTIEDWHELLDRKVTQLPSRRDIDHRKARLVRRISFALFHNAMLLEKVTRLKSHIEGLRDFTQWTFRLEQRDDPNKQVTSAELRRISDMKSFVDQISKFGNLLYDNQPYSFRSEWAIELAPPEPGQTLDLWSEVDTDTLYIDFIVRDAAPDVQPKAIRLRLFVKDHSVYRNGFLSPIMQRVDEIVLDHQKLECHSMYDQFFSLLERPSRRSRPLRQMLAENTFSGSHRKAFEAERADLVYGLGHWMVLLWNTRWSSQLRTSEIRCICLADACMRHSFRPRPDHLFYNFGCHDPTFGGYTLRLLGVALAEIALAFPIDVIKQEDIKFRVGEEIVNRKQLLGMLREKFGRNTITKAVNYCLDPDFDDSRNSLHAVQFDQYCQKIVLP